MISKIKTNKKAAEMAIGTLVVIVLAILVLVVIAVGFGTGWSNLWSKMGGYFSPTNVDTIQQSCNIACTTQSQYDFCNLDRKIVYYEGETKKIVYGTCNSLILKKGLTLDSAKKTLVTPFPVVLANIIENCANIQCPTQSCKPDEAKCNARSPAPNANAKACNGAPGCVFVDAVAAIGTTPAVAAKCGAAPNPEVCVGGIAPDTCIAIPGCSWS